jgi:excisionase family DNA binding protein
MPSTAHLPPPSSAAATAERHGLEWLLPLLTSKGKVSSKMTAADAAKAIGCEKSFVYVLINNGLLETIAHGSHYRVLSRSVLHYLWCNWSGRHHASAPQLMTIIMLALGQLPNRALRQLALACETLISSRRHAERQLIPAPCGPAGKELELFPDHD